MVKTSDLKPENIDRDTRAQLEQLFRRAHKASLRYNGSEQAYHDFLEPLEIADDMIRTLNEGHSNETLEKHFARAAAPDLQGAFTIASLLVGTEDWFYDTLKNNDAQGTLDTLDRGGAVIVYDSRVFVKTDEGALSRAGSNTATSYTIRTAPRLAVLMEHLKDHNIYADDVVVHAGQVSADMVRRHPYYLVQIPKKNAEISLCDQIGEITFISTQILGPTLWSTLTKDQLKQREEITAVPFNNARQWRQDLDAVLSGREGQNLKARQYARRKEPLDIDLIKCSILEHRQATGKWPNSNSGEVEYGPYVGNATWRNLDSALYRGSRGLVGGSGLPTLCQEVSDKYGLDYVNFKNQEQLDIDLIKQSVLAHRISTGKWPNSNSGEVEYGPYAGNITWCNLNFALIRGLRGLAGGSGLPDLCQEVSDEHGLDYFNRLRQEPLDLELIKQSILEHRISTGKWPNSNSGEVEYGPYAGNTKWVNLDAALKGGLRGLYSGSSLPTLCQEVSDKYGLDYVNVKNQEQLDIDLIKQSVLAHRISTGKWPKVKDGEVEYGPYAGNITWGNLNFALYKGLRGLAGGSGLPDLCQEVSDEYGLDYVNIKRQEPLDKDLIKRSILEHRQATGKWPNQKDGEVEYGPYAGNATWRNLDSALYKGSRGLAGGSGLPDLCQEVSDEYGLDYVNIKNQEQLDIDLIKRSILEHRQATGKWPNDKDGEVEYGPYAGSTKWGNLNAALIRGLRGLAGGSGLPDLCQEVSDENGLDYFNRLRQKPLDLELIKQSILEHRKATGKWPNNKDGKVEYGPYAGNTKWGNLDDALYLGLRGLASGSSLTDLCQAVSDEYGLDYKKHGKKRSVPQDVPRCGS